MSGQTQDTLVVQQFGAQASAYLASAVHAAGEDLAALAALAHGRREARVLDMGTGGGHVVYAVAPHVAEVVAYDLSAEMLAVVARTAAERGLANVVTQQGRAEQVPFPDASFDMVVSRYSAHHWGDFDAGLREAVRVAKPGATVGFVDVVSPGRPVLDTYLQAIEVLRDTTLPPGSRACARRRTWSRRSARCRRRPRATCAGTSPSNRTAASRSTWRCSRSASPAEGLRRRSPGQARR